MVKQGWIVLAWLLVVPLVQASPDVQTWQTKNGAKVVYVHAPELPMVDVRVVFDAGSARDGELAGLASFTNSMMTEGAGPWNADQMAERLEDRGIEMGSGSLRDMAWVSVRTLTDKAYLEVALEALAKVLAAPRFDETDVERIRKQSIVGLAHANQSPSSIAQRTFLRTVYAGHPYGHDSIGTEESLAAISVADLKKFHRKYYVAHNAVVAIVGDVDATQAMVLANQLVDELPAGEAANKLPAVPVAEKAVVNTEFPSSQTHIYLGQAGMTRHDPDYFPLYVGNHVLGGSGLVSLLGEEVRNKRGLSYSVYSYFSPMRVEGPFIMVAQTKNQQADQALGVMRDTLQTFIDNGPSDEELGAAVLNITGSFPLSVSSNSKIVNYIAMMGFYDYPMDWLDTLTEKVSAVTREQIQDAFKRRVDPEKLTAVVVGGE